MGLGLMAMTAPVSAQTNYPERAVSLVVGFSPGGTTDVLARIMAKELTEELKQPFVVENKPGAGSTIATDQVARAKPDGYTLLMIAANSTINQTLYKNIKFDIEKDFAPVALIAKVPNILVANKKVPYNSVKELVDFAKADPKGVVYGSAGLGTSIHLAGELFKQQAGIDILHIPYKGSAPAMSAALAGEVSVVFENMPAAAPHIKSGALKAFAVTSAKRSSVFPDVPTLQELGYPDYVVDTWFGIVAPAGTPQKIVDKLNNTMAKILAKPTVIAQLDGLGAVKEINEPEQFSKLISTEVKNWGNVIRKGNISLN
ncbi:Bug family tripartite tricarboxylate transporter substrate binding protein [Advenella sp. RU8]|jgi:tripartite-type tricarboxylate transporter receptor subunit TctC|uniref:Bug family tripartite tricarboxylate transporter substrate binding protein n=1 Tax=Advenella sp. RU8 TaxID=3399575 RepID=UPI003AADECAD